MKELAREYTERMKKLLGSSFDDYENALNLPPVRAFRVNTDKISVEAFENINVFSK